MASGRRPLSPHLQIYRPQLTSLLSITHRATGVFLSIGALLLCYWLLALTAGPISYAKFMRHVYAWYGQILVILFVYSLFYHLCNGIRHLFWDMGKGLEIRTTYSSGYAVVIASLLLTAGTFVLGVAL